MSSACIAAVGHDTRRYGPRWVWWFLWVRWVHGMGWLGLVRGHHQGLKWKRRRRRSYCQSEMEVEVQNKWDLSSIPTATQDEDNLKRVITFFVGIATDFFAYQYDPCKIVIIFRRWESNFRLKGWTSTAVPHRSYKIIIPLLNTVFSRSHSMKSDNIINC